MKLYAIFVILKSPDGGEAKILKKASDLNNFGFFQRSSVEEFLKFTAKIITERTSAGSRSSVKEQDYMAHVYVRTDNLTGVVVSDQEYSNRVAHTLLNKILDEFTKVVPSNTWNNLNEGEANYNDLPALLSKFQNPKEADALTKLQLDLDETKIILHGTIESILQRGEKLDDLVAKSEDLGIQSKTFYKTAKKTNACCSYM
ncbi:synaptobrevin YKT6 -like protein [Brachionus plicatilis]|uniref:Synaptobrevin YKT6-like protein n=1 Tax=Brachionus plicatilis TaxID=10195 RepID=A0A3M7RZA3_BRAPC|nr:synaptobrevin YKT6 -like protein [Brachionus plicatilis]